MSGLSSLYELDNWHHSTQPVVAGMGVERGYWQLPLLAGPCSAYSTSVSSLILAQQVDLSAPQPHKPAEPETDSVVVFFLQHQHPSQPSA